jgi:NAD(P)-dependent dehydrogenase (short-subunit alcohol dehydrogenase family)
MRAQPDARKTLRSSAESYFGRDSALGSPGGETAYHAAKAGVTALTRTVALEVAPFQIRVNAVAPGLTTNPFLEKANPPEYLTEIAAQIPPKRASDPDDVAAGIHFLVTDESATVTGEVLNISGGLYMRL